jgi:hypothetical protein
MHYGHGGVSHAPVSRQAVEAYLKNPSLHGSKRFDEFKLSIKFQPHAIPLFVNVLFTHKVDSLIVANGLNACTANLRGWVSIPEYDIIHDHLKMGLEVAKQHLQQPFIYPGKHYGKATKAERQVFLRERLESTIELMDRLLTEFEPYADVARKNAGRDVPPPPKKSGLEL